MKCFVTPTQPVKDRVQSRRSSIESLTDQIYSTTMRNQPTLATPKSLCEGHRLTIEMEERVRNIPVVSSSYTRIWQRARAKLKSRMCLSHLEKELNLFGANTLPQRGLGSFPAEEFIRKKMLLARNIEDSQPQHIPLRVLLPGGRVKNCWSVVYLLLMVYTVTVAPYSLAFIDESEEWLEVELLIDSLFFLDIVMTFNSGYYNNEGQLVSSRRQIACTYVKSWFLLDLCACCPLYLFQDTSTQIYDDGNNQYNALLRLARLPRLYRLFRVTRIYKMMRQFRNYKLLERIHEMICGKTAVVHVGSFVLMVAVCTHLMSCFWYLVARAEGLSTDCWVYRANLQGSSAADLYVSSLLWSLATLATVGYGDITATTTLERLTAALWMIFGIFVLTLIISSIAIYLQQLDIREVILLNKLEAISELAKETNLDRETVFKLKEAVRFQIDHTGFSLMEKRDLFQDLPRQLKYEVAITMHNNVIKTIPFFANRDQVFISSIVPFLQSTFVASQTFVYREKEYAEEVYFIAAGRCLLMFNESHVIKKLQKGSYFGEIEVIEQVPRLYSIYTGTDCTLLTMKKRLLSVVKSDFPTVYEEMKEVASIRKALNEKSKLQFLRLLRLARAENISQDDMEHFLRHQFRSKMRLKSVKPMRVVNMRKNSHRALAETVEALKKRVERLEPIVQSTQGLLADIYRVVKEMQCAERR